MLRLLLMTTIAVAGFAAPTEPPALMPMPLKMEAGEGALAIDQTFTVTAGLADTRLEGALNRLVARLAPNRHGHSARQTGGRRARHPARGVRGPRPGVSNLGRG